MPILFADDTNMSRTGDNLNLLVDKINVDMTNVYAWAKTNIHLWMKIKQSLRFLT